MTPEERRRETRIELLIAAPAFVGITVGIVWGIIQLANR